MSLMNALAGGVWTLYGMLLEDILVIFPNFMTLVMGIFQLVLIWKYPSKKKLLPTYGKKESTYIS